MTRNHRTTTKWNLFFNYASIVLAIVWGVAMVPLYLRHIPLNLYGAWLATGNILAWLTIVDPGLAAILMQRTAVAYGKRDFAELNDLLTGGVLLSGIISICLLFVGFVLKPHLVNWLKLATTPDVFLLEQAFMLAVIGSALMVFSYGIACFNQGMQSSLGIGLIYVVVMIASLVLTIILLKRGVGLLSIPIGMIVRGAGLTIGNAVYLVYRYMSERIRYRFATSGVTVLAGLGIYSFLGQSANVLSTNVDAFLLTRYLGPEVAPVFAFTRKIPELSRMILERPANAFMPAIAHMVGSREIERARVALVRLIRMILWFMGLLGSGFLVFNGDFIKLWVGQGFYAGTLINAIVILSLLVAVMVKVLSNLCFSLGNIKGNSVVKMVEGILSVILMYAGVNYWGMTGLAIAPLLAMLVVSSWYYPQVFSKLLSLEREDIGTMGREVIFTLIAAGITTSLFVASSATTWLSFAFNVSAFSAIYTILLFLLSKGFRKEVSKILPYKYKP